MIHSNQCYPSHLALVVLRVFIVFIAQFQSPLCLCHLLFVIPSILILVLAFKPSLKQF